MGDGRMSGKVAIITGGGSGLGRACAVRFAQEGAAVCVADRDMVGAAETVRLVEDEGQRGLAFEIDVREEAAHDAMVETCARELGGVDVLVASAGITGTVAGTPPGSQRLLTRPTEMVHEVIAVNLLGVFFADRAVARWLIEHDHPGAIVNISSIGAKLPAIGSFYDATKAGVWSLTKVWALELTEKRIRINAIAPGYIDTPMSRRGMAGPEATAYREAALARVPMGRLGEASEIASAALFLVTDDSSYMTGEMLHVAGGLFVG